MSAATSVYTCSSDERRRQLEETCVSLISAYLAMRGSVVNKLSAMPTKGLVVSKQRKSDSNSEGTSVDSPASNNHQEIARLVCTMVEEQQGLPEGNIVPDSLPRVMRDEATRLHQEDFDSFFDVKEKQEQLETKEISPAELVALHLRSFQNILEYDLDGVQQLKERYIGFFGNILADLLELCYPQLMTYSKYYADERLLNDLKKHREERK